ncbi:MAG: HAD family phosphatase [Proteobacteria bacterium]|nr:HAD family phosphatase [Pseudomonadota bacterium]
MDRASPITTLFLDIGGVLLTNGWDHTMRREAAEHFGIDYEEMNERHHLTFDAYEEGKLALDRYLDRVVFHRERSFSRDDFRTFLFARSRPFEEVIRYFQALKDRFGLRVAAVSNEGRELTIHRIRTFGLGALIQFFVSSCFVHLRKPDEDIYRMALDIAQARPEEVLYVDDRAMFVEVARGLGIRGHHHTGLDSTRRELAAWGLSAEE